MRPGTAGALLSIALLAWPCLAPSEPASEPRRGTLLVAARDLLDPNFRETVVLLIEHTGGGSLGVIINRPTDLALGKAVPELAELDLPGHRLYLGGPVAGDAVNYLAHQAPAGPAMRILDGVYLGGSRQGLRDLLAADAPRDGLRVYLGYAGWGPGQLQREIAHGSWLWLDGRAGDVFSASPERLWPQLIERLDPEGLLTRGATALRRG